MLVKFSLLLLKSLTQTATGDDYLTCHSKGISEVFALTLDLRNELLCLGWYFSNFNHIFFFVTSSSFLLIIVYSVVSEKTGAFFVCNSWFSP